MLCIVVIGRNEGRRLHRALNAAIAAGAPVLYVDSASHDGSADFARKLGVDVHELDPGRPMSAARARNEGAQRVLATHPATKYIQFVDGDTELSPQWCAAGIRALEADPGAGIVFGSLSEQAPEASLYNRMCEREWNPPAPGPVTHCGGNLMVRSHLFKDLGGFRTNIIDGEDIDFGQRIRAAGFKVVYMREPMAVHDAALHRFSQWWIRCVRNGHGVAQMASLHGRDDRFRVKRVASALGWGIIAPAAIIAVALIWPAAWALLAIYPLQVLRLYLKSGSRSFFDFQYAVFLLVGKLPLALGILLYGKRRLLGQQLRLIEFK